MREIGRENGERRRKEEVKRLSKDQTKNTRMKQCSKSSILL